MTHKEKIELLKSTIYQLYVKEGRSKSYIAKLLEVDRRILTNTLNNEWKWIQGNKRYLKPSNQKFLNKNKAFIKSELDNDVPITKIAEKLNTDRHYLTRTIIANDEVLSKAKEDYKARRAYKEPTKFNTPIKDLEGEIWKDILGYKGYKVSNYGRVKSNVVGNSNTWYEIKPNINSKTNRYYIHLYKNGKRKALSLPRIVGHTFLDGYSSENNTINHKDGDVTNNKASNLEWCSQAENNKHAYRELGRPVVKAYQKNGKFTKIKYGDYEFKTIRAFAKFLGISESQAHRYIDDGKVTLIY